MRDGSRITKVVPPNWHNALMTERSLAYLCTVPVTKVSGLSGKRGAALAKAGIRSVGDLLLHVPRRYVDRSTQVDLLGVASGEEVTVIVTVQKVSVRRVRKNLTIIDAVCTDGEGILNVTWFNQAFRAKQLTEGAEIALSGKIERYRGRLQMKAPAVDVLGTASESLTTGRVVPIHPSVGEVGPGYMRRAMHNALQRSMPLSDPLPESLLDRLDLMDRQSALGSIHFPDTLSEVPAARKRLVFDEFFRLEVALALTKNQRAHTAVGISHVPSRDLIDRFLTGLPFSPTGAQDRVLAEIIDDMVSEHPMHRLLQGEVGSGKTVVAVATLLLAVEGGYQGAIMAPTEVLAAQHYLGVSDLLEGAGMASLPFVDQVSLFDQPDSPTGLPQPERPIVVALLTGSTAELSNRVDATRADVLESVASGEADIVIGTHALIQEGVDFGHLGAAVIDEQHRFGVHQRVSLKDKAHNQDPDLLIMTATPIPRTLSMTLYGDLDVSLLDEMPPGRIPVITTELSKESMDEVYELIRAEVVAGRQVFVVCPLVEDSDKIEASSATVEHARLAAVFDDLNVALLHGQMKPREKEAVMDSMRAGDVDVLVATTVIEVGIDIPNATLMVIEDAERFGLSQLHQLRGRVGRGEHVSRCVLLADPTTDEGIARIAAMVETTDGFRLAEEDLRIRGQGTVFEARQAGSGDLRIADLLRDLDILVAARREAFAMVADQLVLNDEIGEEVEALLGDRKEWLFVS